MGDQNEALYTGTIHKLLTLLRYVRQCSRRMRKQGLGGRKIAALRHLHEAGSLTIGQIRDYLYINDSSTSELVAHLESAGYVTRARSKGDNRVVVVTLTPAGRDFAEGAPLDGIPLLREKLKTLPPERLSLIDKALADLLQLLEIAVEH